MTYPNRNNHICEANGQDSEMRITGLKILGREGTHIFFFFFFFFLGGGINFMHFERHFAFQNT